MLEGDSGHVFLGFMWTQKTDDAISLMSVICIKPQIFDAQAMLSFWCLLRQTEISRRNLNPVEEENQDNL